RLSEIVGPTCFGSLNLDQRCSQQIASRLGFATLDELAHLDQTAVYFFFVARIAAEQKIVEIVAVEHDLVTRRLDRANAFQNGAGIFACGLLPPPSRGVQNDQNEQNAEDGAEAHVQFLADRHCQTLRSPWPGACRSHSCRLFEFLDGLVARARKIELNHLSRFIQRGHKLPFLNRVLACLNQQRMTSDGPRALHPPVWRNDYFDLYLPGDVHAPG